MHIKFCCLFQENNNVSDPKLLDSVCMMTFKGAVQCRAYIHAKASVGDAVNVRIQFLHFLVVQQQ